MAATTNIMPQLTGKEEEQRNGGVRTSLYQNGLNNGIRHCSPAGGNRLADIATPTSELVWSSSTLNATPSPEKKAIGKPHKNVVLVPRLSISFVGQVSAIGVQEQHAPEE